MLVTGGRRQPSGVLNPFIRLAAFFGSDGLIVAATPSKVSHMVFLDNALAESDVLFVESVIDPLFPAFSLNFLAIPVRPSANSLKSSRSCPNKSIRYFVGNDAAAAAAAAAATATGAAADNDDADADDDDDDDADADADDDDDDDADDDDDDDNDAVAAANAIAVAVPVSVIVAFLSFTCLLVRLRDRDICRTQFIIFPLLGSAINGTVRVRFLLPPTALSIAVKARVEIASAAAVVDGCACRRLSDYPTILLLDYAESNFLLIRDAKKDKPP